MRPSFRSLLHTFFLTFSLTFLSLPGCHNDQDRRVTAKTVAVKANKSKRGQSQLKRHAKRGGKVRKTHGKRLVKKGKKGKKGKKSGNHQAGKRHSHKRN